MKQFIVSLISFVVLYPVVYFVVKPAVQRFVDLLIGVVE